MVGRQKVKEKLLRKELFYWRGYERNIVETLLESNLLRKS